MAKRKQQQLQEPSLAEKLQSAFDRWDKVYTEGGTDPFYEDGISLMTSRGHIIHYKQEIEKAFAPEDYPEIYHRETPLELPRNYMANPESIRAAAGVALANYLQDENYRYLLETVSVLPPKVEKSLCVKAVIHYAKGLEEAIAKDDLLTMRRHRKHDHYLESFRDCAARVKAYISLENAPKAPATPPAKPHQEQAKPLNISIVKEQITMGKDTIQITFDADKLEALEFYLAEKSLTVEKELQDHINNLYEKNVPAPTRRFLERNDEPSEKTVKADDTPKKSGMTDEERAEFNRQRREQRKAAKEQASTEQITPQAPEQGDAPENDEGEEENQGMKMGM